MKAGVGQGRGAQEHGAGTGDGPLGVGRGGSAHLQGEAVLSLGGGEMGAGGAEGPVPIAAVHQGGAQEQRFRHGGAGAVEAQVGDGQLPRGVTGGDDLVEQVPGQQTARRLHGQAHPGRGPVEGLEEHPPLPLFEGLFAQPVVLHDLVEDMAVGALFLRFPRHAGGGEHIGPVLKEQRGAADLLHLAFPFRFFLTVPRIQRSYAEEATAGECEQFIDKALSTVYTNMCSGRPALFPADG